MDPGTIAAVAGLIVGLVDSLNEAVQSGNRKEASEIRQQANMILSQFNLKLNHLRSALEQKGINYNRFKEQMMYSSPSSYGRKLLEKETKDYDDQVKQANGQINKLQNQAEAYSAIQEGKASAKESHNIVKDIAGSIMDVGTTLFNSITKKGQS